MTFYVFLRGLLVPPALQILMLLLGLWCLRHQRRVWGGGLIVLALLSLYFVATPFGAAFLASGLQRQAPLNPAQPNSWQGAQAIVVIGGGRDTAPEFGGRDMPNYWTASRLRYAAFLYRQSGLPLAVSGGVVLNEKEPEAAVMARSLQQDHVVNVRWQESRSRTTWENAQYTHRLLAAEGIGRIVLVTQSLHMARAKMAFEHAGFQVIAAPIDFDGDDVHLPWLLRLTPAPARFMKSAQALHEYVGLAAYRIRMLLE